MNTPDTYAERRIDYLEFHNSRKKTLHHFVAIGSSIEKYNRIFLEKNVVENTG